MSHTIDDDVIITGDLTVDGCLTFTNAGSVTQITSITTSVTVNNCVGVITTVSSTLAGGSSANFTVNNTTVTSSSGIILSTQFDGSGSPYALVRSVSSGSFIIRVRNNGGVALDDTMKISFFVII
ncbi:MAG: hypothetical protein N2B06_16945 [Clostridium sp.]